MRWTLVLPLVLAALACSDLPSSPDRPTVPTATLRLADAELRAAAQGRRSRGIEDEFLRMEAREPGFAGMFRSPSGELVVQVVRGASGGRVREEVMRTINSEPAFRGVARSAAGGRVRENEVTWRFSELVAMQQLLAQQPLPSSVGIDADERQNRVRIAVSDIGAEPEIRRIAAAAGIPSEALIVEPESGIRATANLRETVRPLGGGLQISNAGRLCSMGFIVDVAVLDLRGFLTAAHCRGSNSAKGDGATGAPIQQSVMGLSTKVGEIAINPAWNLTVPACGGFNLCTLVDAMFVERDGVSLANMPKRVLGSASLPANNQAGSYGIATSWSGFTTGLAVVGDSVDKIGRTAGRTRGALFETCVVKDIETEASFPNDSLYRVLCLNGVDGAMADHGDSGGPIFIPGAQPIALGIQTGSNILSNHTCPSGQCRYWYSGWSEIQAHLGYYLFP